MTAASTEAEAPRPLPDDLKELIQVRLVVVENIHEPSKYDVKVVTPIEVRKLLPVDDGLSFCRLNDPPVQFHEISAMCVLSVI